MNNRRVNIVKAATMVYKSNMHNTSLLLIRSIETNKIVGARILYNTYWSRIPDGEDVPHNGITIDMSSWANLGKISSKPVDMLPITASFLQKGGISPMNTRKQMKLRTLQWYWDPFVRIDLMKRIYEYEGKVSYQQMNRRIRDMNIKILQKL